MIHTNTGIHEQTTGLLSYGSERINDELSITFTFYLAAKKLIRVNKTWPSEKGKRSSTTLMDGRVQYKGKEGRIE